jgi:hypothetical protein
MLRMATAVGRRVDFEVGDKLVKGPRKGKKKEKKT